VLSAVREGVLEYVEVAVPFPVEVCVTDRVGLGLTVINAVPLCVTVGLAVIAPVPVPVLVELGVPVRVLVADFVWEAVV